MICMCLNRNSWHILYHDLMRVLHITLDALHFSVICPSLHCVCTLVLRFYAALLHKFLGLKMQRLLAIVTWINPLNKMGLDTKSALPLRVSVQQIPLVWMGPNSLWTGKSSTIVFPSRHVWWTFWYDGEATLLVVTFLYFTWQGISIRNGNTVVNSKNIQNYKVG